MTKNRLHTLMQRLAARKAIALLTGSHASFGLADRMRDFGGYRTVGQSQDAADAFRERFPKIVEAWKNEEGDK